MVRTRQYTRRTAAGGLRVEEDVPGHRHVRMHARRVQFARELHVSAQAVAQWDTAVTLLSNWSSKMARRPYRRWFQALTSADVRMASASGTAPRPAILTSFALQPAFDALELGASSVKTTSTESTAQDTDTVLKTAIVIEDNGDQETYVNDFLPTTV